MKRLSLLTCLVLLVCVVASTAKAKDPPLRWMPMSYGSFDVDTETGMLASCIYQAFPPDSSLSVVNDRGTLKVDVKHQRNGRISIRLLISNKISKWKPTEEDVKDVFSLASERCYDVLAR